MTVCGRNVGIVIFIGTASVFSLTTHLTHLKTGQCNEKSSSEGRFHAQSDITEMVNAQFARETTPSTELSLEQTLPSYLRNPGVGGADRQSTLGGMITLRRQRIAIEDC